MKKTQKGFTLVELLVVIAILAILATVSVVGYTSFIDRANQSNALTEAHQINSSIETSLFAKDFAKVTSTVYASLDSNGVLTFTTTEPAEGKEVVDISGDFTGFNLALDNGKLIYTSAKGVKVDVATEKVVPAT